MSYIVPTSPKTTQDVKPLPALVTDGDAGEAPVADDVAAMVRRLAEIQDELLRRGCNALLDEEKKLREALKDQMIAEECDRVFDEVSGATAKLSPVTEDIYRIELLKLNIPAALIPQVIVAAVDADALKEAIRIGAVSRARLEKVGAITKGLKYLMLRVTAAKEPNA